MPDALYMDLVDIIAELRPLAMADVRTPEELIRLDELITELERRAPFLEVGYEV
jgi:hypothetical protein